MFRKKYLLLTFFLIIIFQALLYTNNNHKTSFRYFKWTLQEVSIGKLISISFFSGLLISTILINTNTNYKKYPSQNSENIEEDYEPIDIEEGTKTNIEMPPQRDIRDAQPTISVNYRVVKSTEENNLKGDRNYSNSTDKKDDWNHEENDW